LDLHGRDGMTGSGGFQTAVEGAALEAQALTYSSTRAASGFG
jgi:hypothetical protein